MGLGLKAPYLTKQWLWEFLELGIDKHSANLNRAQAHFLSLPNPNQIQETVVNIAVLTSFFISVLSVWSVGLF
jgi:hypothetical protein